MRWARVKTSDKLLTPCQYTYTAYQPEVARISQHELFLDMPVSGWLSGGMALLVGIVGRRSTLPAWTHLSHQSPATSDRA